MQKYKTSKIHKVFEYSVIRSSDKLSRKTVQSFRNMRSDTDNASFFTPSLVVIFILAILF